MLTYYFILKNIIKYLECNFKVLNLELSNQKQKLLTMKRLTKITAQIGNSEPFVLYFEGKPTNNQIKIVCGGIVINNIETVYSNLTPNYSVDKSTLCGYHVN